MFSRRLKSSDGSAAKSLVINTEEFWDRGLGKCGDCEGAEDDLKWISSAVVDRVKGVLLRRGRSSSGDFCLASLWETSPACLVVGVLTCVLVPDSKGVPVEPKMESSKPSSSSLPSLAAFI